ncbi:class I SAM-dependent methyltransferase [Hwanghaeella grinnelliae]|uniref:Class I SAM-dependent methyltransferase n=1 Tax=Hwanghaeella grinnelliae TaxID=2500179 RepID=A0A437QN36_9PROT|nr:class I SAM-dependent methyltransferase [Hwanghaeella grinnelliae]RVU35865.1 class I SAM-dependent methyltransferase [Hwanghaeella grinnelliae]
MTADTKPTPHAPSAPLRWIASCAADADAGQSVLDLACGGGRHGRAFLERGCRVTFVDVDTAGVADLSNNPDCEILQADLENAAWPLAGRTFEFVVVTNYLWRPILPQILASVAPGGALLYQTFALGNERLGRPRNPDFLLKPGELKTVAETGGFDLIDFFEGEVTDPKPAVIQRLHARKGV